MANIRIKDLPLDGTPNAGDRVPIDLGTTRQATVESFVMAGRPTASKSEAEAGTDTKKAMTPLTVKQAIDAQTSARYVPVTRRVNSGAGLSGGQELTGDVTLSLNSASVASLAKADTAVQPARSITASTGLTGGGDLSADRSIELSPASIASLGKADTAIQAPGGDAGQILIKNSNATNDVAWVSSDAATAVSYGPQTLTAAQQVQARQNIQADKSYDSIASVAAATVPSFANAIRTNGYYAAGDGGDALYKRVASEPSHAGKVQSADGAWWEEVPDTYDNLGSALSSGRFDFTTSGFSSGSVKGGGYYKWNATRPKNDHDGGSVIDPVKNFPTDWSNQAQVDAWFTASLSGVGCYEKILQGTEGWTDLDYGASVISRALNHRSQILAMLKGSVWAGRSTKLLSSPYRSGDAILVNATLRGASLVGTRQPNGRFTKFIRYGVADAFRSVFHVTTSETFFDKVYLYAADGFSERGGITYGLGAGRNSLGDIEGAYWRLGVVYPQGTDARFDLDVLSVTALFSGRSYSSDCPATPPGNVRIGQTRGVFAGFVDISGGSVEIGRHTMRGARSQLIKKGNQAAGGVIRVGKITATNCIVTSRLTIALNEAAEGVVEGSGATGTSSGATGVVVGVARDRVDLKNVSGVFSVGENITVGGVVCAVTATEVFTPKSGGIEGAIGNAGTHFDLFEIGDVYIQDYHGDPLWILNSGIVSIGRLVAKNIWGGRHLLRVTPEFSSEYPRKVSIGSYDITGAVMQDSGVYHPVFLSGDGKVDIQNLSLVDVEASSRSYCLNLSMQVKIDSLTVATFGGTFSRFIHHNAAGAISFINQASLSFDVANRIGQNNAGVLLASNGRYTTGTAGWDGAGTTTATNFSAL